MSYGLPFPDRRTAGRVLARELARFRWDDPVVLALPRGGVPVGYEIAAALRAPLDILLVRKIGAPRHSEFGIGAVVDGAHPQRVIDADAARMAGADDTYIEAETSRQLAEIERRRALYRPGDPEPLAGRTAIVVDDGIATGGTVRAALLALSGAGAARIVLAVPVAPREVIAEMVALCDRVVCLATPEPFGAVGRFYRDFTQTGDAEVVRLLADARQRLEPATSS
jgi:predicted phosphoribosyltransferase